MSDSPVVRLNRAVAVAMADDPLAGPELLDQVVDLDDYHLLWATRGELSRRATRDADARHARSSGRSTWHPTRSKLLCADGRGSRCPTSELLDAQSRDGPADDELLDLLGAFEDVVGLSETYPLVAGGLVFAA